MSERTPPASLYRDPQLYARSLEEVFARSPQVLEDFHAVDGLWSPVTLLEGSLDEPLLVRGERVLSNVCTHRGALMCREPARSLRCPYHGRRFDRSGRLSAAPGFSRAADFPSEDDHLPALEPRRTGPLSWVQLLGEPPELPELAQALERRDWSRARFDGVQDFSLEASWALYVDNYLEGLHIPFVHPTLNAALDLDAYRVELFEGGALQVGVDAQGHEVALYFWVFPNTMVNLYDWGLSLNLVQPQGVGRTRVRYVRWVTHPELLGAGPGAGLDRVELEDHEVVLRCQAGLRSRLSTRGRYSPEHETALRHFHRMLSDRLLTPPR